jgi:hypothetical protein
VHSMYHLVGYLSDDGAQWCADYPDVSIRFLFRRFSFGLFFADFFKFRKERA